MKKLTKSDNGNHVHLKMGDRFVIELDENATTGYTWKIESFDEDQLKPIKEDLMKLREGIGAGGKKVIEFEVIGNGTTKIELSLTNSWTGDVADAFRVTLENK